MTTTILILIGIATLIYNVWNTIVLKKFFKTSFRREQINDQKYWELKYKIQSLVTIFLVIVGVVGYLGISTIDDVKKTVVKEIKPQLDSTMMAVDSLRDSLKTYSLLMEDLKSNSQQVTSSLKISKNDVQSLINTINAINKKNKIQAPVYVVNNIRIDTQIDFGDPKATIYFKDLITSSGDKLPSFTKPPTVVVAANRANFYATSITPESFRIYQTMLAGLPGEKDIPKYLDVTLIIIQNP